MKTHLPLTIAAIIGLIAGIPPVHAETTAAHVAAIQARGDTDISARLTSLDSLIAKVSAAKRLTSTEKTTVTSDIQNQISALGTLKTTLDSASDVTSARTNFQYIFTQHYIYAFYLPNTNRIVAADDEGQAATTLTGLVTKFQSLINTASAAGNNVSAVQAVLNDLQAKAADATTQSTAVINSLSTLTSAGYPGNKTTVTAAGTTLKSTRTELTAARADAQNIVSTLKTMLFKTAVATPTATATTPSSTP